jgi:hypothetical protein
MNSETEDKDKGLIPDIEKAKQGLQWIGSSERLLTFYIKTEIERLRLWHKEVALRRKRTLEQERKSKEVEELEQKETERKKAEVEGNKQVQKQQLLEFKRLKRAEVCTLKKAVYFCILI